MLIAFIVVVGILVYTWIVYPGIVLWLGRGRVESPKSKVQSSGREVESSGREVESSTPSKSSIPSSEGLGVGSLPSSKSEIPSSEGLGVGSLPPIAVLISAHNEEAVILQRLENLAALDYPADRLHVYIGVDGGSDRTAELVEEWGASFSTPHFQLSLLVSSLNQGKSAMLKKLVERSGRGVQSSGKEVQSPKLKVQSSGQEVESSTPSKSEIPSLEGLGVGSVPSTPPSLLIIFTDANTMFAPDALRRLVAPFCDDKVGGVCGRLVFEEQNSGARIRNSESRIRNPEWVGTDEGHYWNLETRLKVAESALDSCLGANGAIYAIRAELFPAIFPANTIIDDFVIGMKVREQGYRLVYEPAAVATEQLPATVRDEWRRRVRIGAGAYQALALCWHCLLPRYGVFAWMFWSHKVFRWFTPQVGVSGVLVIGYWLFGGNVKVSYTGMGVMAVIGMLVGATGWGRKGFRLFSYFLVMQAALFIGFLRFCRGNLSGAWTRTERGA